MTQSFNHAAGRQIRIGDADLYVEEAGDPAGLPLLLLHGGLGSLVDFNPILDGLPRSLRLIGIDFRGHGRSTLGGVALTYAQYQADVLAVLDQLGVQQFALLGFSDGGIVAYRLAAQQPQRVLAVVTVGAQWQPPEAGSPVFEMLSGLTAQMWTEMFPDAVAYYERTHPAPDLEALVRAVVGLWTDGSASGYPGAEGVARITAPLLLLRGDQDPLFSLDEAVALIGQVEGAHFFNLPFAGHEVHRDAPQMFLLAVADFLARPRRRQGDTP